VEPFCQKFYIRHSSRPGRHFTGNKNKLTHQETTVFFLSPETIYGYRFIVKLSRDNKKS
jgi:hypothetical protein